MSESTLPPPSSTELVVQATEEEVLPALVSEKTKKTPSPKYISATDLGRVVEILVGADNISPEEAVKRLNNMCEKGYLLIVPPFGGTMKRR